MGFMDKAKKLAEQAQTKLDEVQQQFNEKQATGGATSDPTRPHVEYDKHGRPMTPAEDRLEPEPGPSRPQGDPADEFPKAPEAPKDKSPSVDPPADKSPSISPPPAPPASSPDPKPGMTSGDPLSGG
jgi:hypothetical protein